MGARHGVCLRVFMIFGNPQRGRFFFSLYFFATALAEVFFFFHCTPFENITPNSPRCMSTVSLAAQSASCSDSRRRNTW